MPHPRRRIRDRAVSPVVAVLLMLAITVVLASVMYLTVSQLIPPAPQTATPLGVIVLRAGDNWVVEVAAVSPGIDPSHVYMQVLDPNGTMILPYTALVDIAGFIDDNPQGFLNAGDIVMLPLQDYPEKSWFTIKDDQRMLTQGMLRT